MYRYRGSGRTSSWRNNKRIRSVTRTLFRSWLSPYVAVQKRCQSLSYQRMAPRLCYAEKTFTILTLAILFQPQLMSENLTTARSLKFPCKVKRISAMKSARGSTQIKNTWGTAKYLETDHTSGSPKYLWGQTDHSSDHALSRQFHRDFSLIVF